MRNPYPRLKVEWALVTPQMAAGWLAKDRVNRPVNQSWIRQYAHDIAEGRWGLSESAIVIAQDGSCINGQHRLEAVVASETGIWSVVVTGVPSDAIFDMDQGKKRTFIHAYNLRHKDNGKLQNNIASMAALAFVYPPTRQGVHAKGAGTSPGLTHHDREQAIIRYKDAVDWCSGQFTHPLRNITIAPVMAPVARAYYSCKKDGKLNRLAEFAKVLMTGESNGPKDNSAIRLRNFLFNSLAYGGDGRVATYFKTEYALVAFLAEKPIDSLLGVTKEAFEVPDRS